MDAPLSAATIAAAFVAYYVIMRRLHRATLEWFREALEGGVLQMGVLGGTVRGSWRGITVTLHATPDHHATRWEIEMASHRPLPHLQISATSDGYMRYRRPNSWGFGARVEEDQVLNPVPHDGVVDAALTSEQVRHAETLLVRLRWSRMTLQPGRLTVEREGVAPQWWSAEEGRAWARDTLICFSAVAGCPLDRMSASDSQQELGPRASRPPDVSVPT